MAQVKRKEQIKTKKKARVIQEVKRTAKASPTTAQSEEQKLYALWQEDIETLRGKGLTTIAELQKEMVTLVTKRLGLKGEEAKKAKIFLNDLIEMDPDLQKELEGLVVK